jgi:hypothetical protein
MGKRGALLFLPGTLFWVLIAAGIITKNNALIGAGVVLAAVTIVTALTLQVRAATAASAARQRLWDTGTPATATIVKLSSGRGGRTNGNPHVELELSVAVPGREAYAARVATTISSLAVPRVQPGCQIAVRVDPADAARLAIDPELAR